MDGQKRPGDHREMIQFTADRIRITERLSDNSYKVECFTGEYEQEKMVEIMALPKDVAIKISLEVEE